MQTISQQSSGIIVENYDVNAMSQVDTNPLEVRWGFNPVQRDKILDARNAGIAHVPFARFFPIRSFKSPRERHSIDWTQPKEEIEIITAEAAQRMIEESLAGKSAQVPVDWGLRVGFMGERDIAKMEVLTQTLLPTLDTIREICTDHGFSQPIGDVCEGSDSDFGSRDTCVTCWQRWLNSAALQSYCEIVAAQGLPVTERDARTGELKNRLIRPTFDELEAGLTLVQDSFRAGIASLQNQWRTIATEEEKNERKSITVFEDSYRKDLHENKPQDRQIAMVEKFAKASGGASNQNGDLIAALAQSTLQTQQMIAAMMQQNQQNQNQQNLAPAANPAASDTDEQKAAFVAKMAEAKRKKNEGDIKEDE